MYPQCLLFVATICLKCRPRVLSGKKKMSQLRRRTVIQSGRTAGTNKASKGTLSRVLLSKENYAVHLCYIILYLYYTVCLHSYCITACCDVCKFFGLLSWNILCHSLSGLVLGMFYMFPCCNTPDANERVVIRRQQSLMTSWSFESGVLQHRNTYLFFGGGGFIVKRESEF